MKQFINLPYVKLTNDNWKLIILLSIIISQKIVDDDLLNNSEFVHLWKIINGGNRYGITIYIINKLEVIYLTSLRYDLNVTRTKYFDVFDFLFNISAQKIEKKSDKTRLRSNT
mgnify:CR=1 FL=1|jgi:hypothetical protein